MVLTLLTRRTISIRRCAAQSGAELGEGNILQKSLGPGIFHTKSYFFHKMAVLDLAASSELCEDNNSKWKNTLRGKASTQEKPQWKAAVKVVENVFFIN